MTEQQTQTPITCRQCDGSGSSGMFTCDICRGRGTVKDEATFQRRLATERMYRRAAMDYHAEDEAMDRAAEREDDDEADDDDE